RHGAEMTGVQGDDQAAALPAAVIEGAHLSLHLHLVAGLKGDALEQGRGCDDIESVFHTGETAHRQRKEVVTDAVIFVRGNGRRCHNAPQDRPIFIPASFHTATLLGKDVAVYASGWGDMPLLLLPVG